MANKIRTINPPQLDPNISQAANIPYEGKSIPLNGKLDFNPHQSLLGTNFRTLMNMRYAEGHPESVLGMTRLTAGRIHPTYYLARSCFHFIRELHPETHVLVHALNAAKTASAVIRNVTAIPNAGEFNTTVLWLDSLSAHDSKGVRYSHRSAYASFFSAAPNGGVCYCNGWDVCLWEGDETKVAAFITGSNALTYAYQDIENPYDATPIINDTMQEPNHVVKVGA